MLGISRRWKGDACQDVHYMASILVLRLHILRRDVQPLIEVRSCTDNELEKPAKSGIQARFDSPCAMVQPYYDKQQPANNQPTSCLLLPPPPHRSPPVVARAGPA